MLFRSLNHWLYFSEDFGELQKFQRWDNFKDTEYRLKSRSFGSFYLAEAMDNSLNQGKKNELNEFSAQH